MPLAQTPDFAACLATSERAAGEAVAGGEGCERCPEGCAMALLLQAAAHEFDGVEACSTTLLLYVRARMYFKDFEPHWTEDLLTNLPALVNARRGQCAAERRRALLRERLPGTAAWDSPAFQQLPRADGGASGARRAVASEQVALLVAATPSMLRVYQPFVNLWRCYALRHGLAFILETDDTEVAPPHRRAPNWLRWFAARRHIGFYSALLIVDPDQVIVPECWSLSIAGIAGAWPEQLQPRGGGLPHRPPPDVGTRDFGRPQTLNNGVVFLRSSPRGVFFLEQLLRKASWMQTIEKDQGPFDETVLEVLGLEAKARGEEGYDSECAQYLFANSEGNHEVARYALCWWRVSEELAGPFGARRSDVVRFVDPRDVDINHVVGSRGLSDPALLYHFAGRSKDWDSMLRTFGMERRNTADCGKVLDYVETRAAAAACVPGGPVVEECEPPEVVC